MSDQGPLIEFQNITKKFDLKVANDQVSFCIRSGTIHAIVGENGAGKSTIMKMLFGMYEPTSGKIILNQKDIHIKNPAIAKDLGIGMVHQHFMLAGPISALDHVILEMTPQHLRTNSISPLHRQKIAKQLEELASAIQMPVDWSAKIEDLPVGIQQRIEILKLLFNESKILILDEPTAVLTPQETEEFLKRLQSICRQGKTIILITHKLKEVFAVADDITVFRKGRVVRSGPAANWNAQSLAEDMIGQPYKEITIEPPKFKGKGLNPALQFNSKAMNLKVERGEIVGIAGVEGNGQSELIRWILNPRDARIQEQSIANNDSVEITINGCTSSILSNRQIRSLGVGYLAEDRHSKGSSVTSTLFDNFLMGQHRYFQKWGLLDFGMLEDAFNRACALFDVQFQSGQQKLEELSGGNQQKLVVARELSRPLNLLVAAHPTRGVDIQAIKTIHQAFLDARDQGTGVLLVSSELDELMKLSDRIVVLYKNSIIAEFSRDKFDEKSIGAAMAGLKS